MATVTVPDLSTADYKKIVSKALTRVSLQMHSKYIHTSYLCPF